MRLDPGSAEGEGVSSRGKAFRGELDVGKLDGLAEVLEEDLRGARRRVPETLHDASAAIAAADAAAAALLAAAAAAAAASRSFGSSDLQFGQEHCFSNHLVIPGQHSSSELLALSEDLPR